MKDFKEIINEGASGKGIVEFKEFLSESRAKANEGIMSELDIMAKEAGSFEEFQAAVFSVPEYQKHRGKRDVIDFLKQYYQPAKR